MSAEKVIPEELWNSLNSLDPLEVSRRSLASYDEKIQGYSLKILDGDYLVFPEKQIIKTVQAPSPEPLPFYLQLSCINYLIGAKDIPLSGQWVSEKQFPAGPIFFRGPHEMPTRKLEQIFSQDLDGFTNASTAQGGKKVEGGDMAYEFLVFPKIPARIILWLADEEFPARVSFLFDRTANVHLQLDALYAVGKVLESALLEAKT
ncbi:MAG: DUF3786 domain-containing protein [Candidatus Aminicenantes bacterium]|nr:DUF3786 domain-containing protein [Candidatus Aminicenantes bacterium]